MEDYSFCIHSRFQQVYATSRHFSWTDAKEFVKFCRDAGIPCEALPVDRYFREGSCDGAFLTEEYTYDAHILRDFFLEELGKQKGVELLCGREVTRIVEKADCYEIYARHQGKEERYEAPFVLNATYASVNQVLELAETDRSLEPFRIKYELCEIILCRVGDCLRDIGLTVWVALFSPSCPLERRGTTP